MKRNLSLIITVILTVILCSILIYRGTIDISILLTKDNGIHFNLLTVSSIIGGFMFSGLSLLVGVSGNRLVKKQERANHMERIYNNTMAGIISCGISIIISLALIFCVFNYSETVKKIIASIEVMSIAIGIVCFLLAVIDLRFIVSLIHKGNKVVPDEVLSDMKKAMKENKNNKKPAEE